MFYEYFVGICVLIVMITAIIGFKWPKLSVLCAKIVITSGAAIIFGSVIYVIVKTIVYGGV